MSAWTFYVDGLPATKGSWKVSRGKLRPDNERERPWANAIAWCAKAAGVRETARPVRISIDFFFPKPKKPTNPFPSRNDVDKLARSALDALTHIAWSDDQQVVDLHVTKRWAEPEMRRVGASFVIEEIA